MKKLILLLTGIITIFLITNKPIKAQDTIRSRDMYRICVDMNNESNRNIGILYETKDSSIVMSYSRYNWEYLENDIKKLELNIKDINTINTRKQTSVRNGLIVGTLLGIAAAIIYSSSDGVKNRKKSQNIIEEAAQQGSKVFISGLCVISGIAIGGLFGSVSVKFPIKGSKEKYQKHRKELREYSIKK